MSGHDREILREIRTFPSLVKFLRDDLDWPIKSEDFEDLTFDFDAEELGIDAKTAAKIETIKQLRPLTTNQPWGIFFLKFEPKRLPVVAMRRILGKLVIKKRAAANASERASWDPHDLLFISSYGEGDERQISLAHFSDPERGDLPGLKVLGWDGDDTQLKLDHVASELRTKLRWPDHPNEHSQWRDQWSSAFTLGHREVIRTSQDLAIRLADLACAIRKKVNAALGVESEKGPLRTLMKAFQEALIHDLKEDDFADMYAQTIAYGLLSARVSRPAGLVADDVALMVPITNPFLRELMETFLHIGGRKRKGAQAGLDFDELGINDVVALLRAANRGAVLRDFGNRNPTEDPVIHFYELFLKEYDAKKRLQRGVFYTPRPVVSFIVRSVDELLRTEFGLEDGLADTATWGDLRKRFSDLKLPEGVKGTDTFVCILDPATGTGTFLVEIIDLIYRTLQAKWSRAGKKPAVITDLWNEYVPRYLLTRLHGYELMMAPYAIAHMKIGLKLAETGYRFGSEERARIFLTNSLEAPHDASGRFAFDVPALAHESQAVNSIKRLKRLTVVVGNPPYSVSSHNKSDFIESLMGKYKEGLNRERNIQPLSDDYVKFIRFAHLLIDTAGHGILGYITNHSYLSGIIHRTLRKSLMDSFEHVQVLDLHGNSFINEHPPEGIQDENVFEIQQGVSLSIATKNGGLCRSIRFAELWGSAASKLSVLGTGQSVQYRSLNPTPEYYFFVPKDFSNTDEFMVWPALNEVFGVAQNGIQTGHDGFIVGFDAGDVLTHVTDFLSPSLSDSAIREKYELGDNSGWKLEEKRRILKGGTIGRDKLIRYFYRPFDIRYIYYEPHLLKRSSPAIMPHLANRKNMALFSMRKIVPNFSYSFFGVVNSVVDHGFFYMGNQGSSSCFPLYLYRDQPRLGSKSPREHNFLPKFLIDLARALDLTLDDPHHLPRTLTPEDVFHFVYSVFHSPVYRKRYAEFLKIDFPRLPLPGSISLFRKLADRGETLVRLHLLETTLPIPGNHAFVGPLRCEVEKVAYSDDTVWIDKNKTRGFRCVPKAVWEFQVGGYQVCEKWLKDRKGRTLSKEDIDHYRRVVFALGQTIRLMGEIDQVIEEHGGWPGAFVSTPLSGGPGEPALPFE